MSTEFTARDLRNALSAFPTGVTIVTARDGDGQPVGMTATSFNSVSIDPALVLWSVTKTARSAPAFKAAEHFAIHVLAADQTALSNGFAKSGEDKFADVNWRANDRDVPILADVPASFHCRTWAVYEGGDHWIIVGEIERLDTAPREPLVFSRGAYATASAQDGPAIRRAPMDDDEPSAIDDLLFYQVSRLTRDMTRELHAEVNAAGLTVAEWRLLATLFNSPPRPLGSLGARTFLDGEALADLVATLSGRALLVQTKDACVEITPQGSALVSPLFEQARKTAEHLRAGGHFERLKSLL